MEVFVCIREKGSVQVAYLLPSSASMVRGVKKNSVRL